MFTNKIAIHFMRYKNKYKNQCVMHKIQEIRKLR